MIILETAREFTYRGDMVNASERCEAAMTARTRYGWVTSWECGELLYDRRFPLKLKMAVYKRYRRPTILHGHEA